MQGVVHKDYAIEFNYSIAFFLRDLLSLADRGRVFHIIRQAFAFVAVP